MSDRSRVRIVFNICLLLLLLAVVVAAACRALLLLMLPFQLSESTQGFQAVTEDV